MAGWEPRILSPEALRELLVQFGWTQQDFATQLGISLNTVQRWASGANESPQWLADYVDAVRVVMTPGSQVAAPVQLVAETLQEILAELGWSQVYLGRRINVVKSTIYRWTTDEYVVPAWVCAYLAVVLEIRRIAVRLGVAR